MQSTREFDESNPVAILDLEVHLVDVDDNSFPVFWMINPTPSKQQSRLWSDDQRDRQRPNPFRPDIVIDITSVMDRKIHAMAAHESQFFEWLPWIGGYAEEVPKDRAQWEPWLKKRMEREIPADLRKALDQWYEPGKAANAKFVEAFEICEYGKQPTPEEIRKIFPMFGK